MSITKTTINTWLEEYHRLKRLLDNVKAGKKVLTDEAASRAQSLDFVPETARHGYDNLTDAKTRFAELRAKLDHIADEHAGEYPAGTISTRAADPAVIIEDLPYTIGVLEEDQALAAAVIQKSVDLDAGLLRRLMNPAQLEAAGIQIVEGRHLVVGGPK